MGMHTRPSATKPQPNRIRRAVVVRLLLVGLFVAAVAGHIQNAGAFAVAITAKIKCPGYRGYGNGSAWLPFVTRKGAVDVITFKATPADQAEVGHCAAEGPYHYEWRGIVDNPHGKSTATAMIKVPEGRHIIRETCIIHGRYIPGQRRSGRAVAQSTSKIIFVGLTSRPDAMTPILLPDIEAGNPPHRAIRPFHKLVKREMTIIGPDGLPIQMPEWIKTRGYVSIVNSVIWGRMIGMNPSSAFDNPIIVSHISRRHTTRNFVLGGLNLSIHSMSDSSYESTFTYPAEPGKRFAIEPWTADEIITRHETCRLVSSTGLPGSWSPARLHSSTKYILFHVVAFAVWGQCRKRP